MKNNFNFPQILLSDMSFKNEAKNLKNKRFFVSFFAYFFDKII